MVWKRILYLLLIIVIAGLAAFGGVLAGRAIKISGETVIRLNQKLIYFC
jgi:hypothetical protein